MLSSLQPRSRPPLRWSQLTKKARFALILAAAMLVTVLVSLVVRAGFLGDSAREPLTVAVVGPLSGPDAALGLALRKGAALRADTINAAGGIAGRPVVVKPFDDEGDKGKSLEIARRVSNDPSVLAVIGHTPDAADSATAIYAQRQIPLIAPRPLVRPGDAAPSPWLFSITLDRTHETRFLANYVRNVVGEPTVAIVREDSEQAAAQAGQFDAILQRFGTRLVGQWTFAPGRGGASALPALAQAVKEKMPTGAIVVIGSAVDSARVVVALRDAGVRNLIAGSSEMASSAFRTEIVAQAQTNPKALTPEAYGHGLLVSSPVLFDTANERAQRFYGQYVKRFNAVPDWAAALGADGVDLIAGAIAKTNVTTGKPDGEDLRRAIADHDRAETAFQGTVGTWTFDNRGQATLPVMMASYNGLNPVAALTQLQPIREAGVSNFLEEVTKGRALYVNDRFMYKTDVIYTGVQLHEIRDLNPDANEATLNLTIWFRYRGAFNPADVVFTNAVKPVELGKPYREERGEVTTYVAYRIEGRFALNVFDQRPPYGSQTVGVSFRHRTQNRNTVMFVTDVLGMSLVDTNDFVEKLKAMAAAETASAVDPGLADRFRRALEGESESSTLLDQLRAKRVLAPSPGWRLSRAWISQDVASVGSEGDPNYVGFGRPQPDFSRVDFGVVAAPDSPAARDFIHRDFFVYIAIFSAVLAVFAAFMDRRDRGQFWKIQTLFMRILSWPLLLMSVGNIALDQAVATLPPSGIAMVVNGVNVLWWIVPAILVDRTLERFVWTPLEIRTQRKIPGIVRRFSTLIVFGFAGCGIIAFVLKQPITSLLAASGLVGMVIGLAIQANIANVFSGIVLNIERPFQIGDSIQITDLVRGVVVDMTWRTVRIRNVAGFIVAMPNAKVSEATVINFSAVDRVSMKLEYYADARHDPGRMGGLLTTALQNADKVMASATGGPPFVRYDGIRGVNGQWLCKYNMFFWVEDYDASFVVPELVWRSVYRTLAEAGIEPTPPDLMEAAGPAAVATNAQRQAIPV
ncbi:ABC transporter substrate-binding protein [Azospirillum formosense]|uniref:ABC transporter substrate-binding protein n=1 Tax=Azospirillum formosense TaxID=861533 RepID=A0ABX2KXQ1_9PROT|nr:ABC transporter substrate-binding protein [Azospirillum formosense]MBY3754466.1 ABC transporter substrate-binding protein [Azospirillum formosense]NUB20403.1 ABC transporter substrate-binding protein [Azospirillum formosense]